MAFSSSKLRLSLLAVTLLAPAGTAFADVCTDSLATDTASCNSLADGTAWGNIVYGSCMTAAYAKFTGCSAWQVLTQLVSSN